MKLPTIACLVALLGSVVAARGEARAWTSTDGTTISAELLSFDGKTAALKLGDGRIASVPMERLSPNDQGFLRAQHSAPAPKGWPAKVTVSSASIEVKLAKDEPEARRYVYTSGAFSYTSQGKLLPSLMKEVARTFEATRQLVNELPWGIVCKPPEGRELYEAMLFETRRDYLQAGGPENSGGVYMTAEKIFKIPFESLGIKRLGKSYTKDENYSSDTLVHEITHQLMHDYLPYLPQWCVEGSAEYTEMLPYRAGEFGVARCKEGLRDYLDVWRKRGREPKFPAVSELFRMTRPQWESQAATPSRMGELYQQSALLVYYFNHLDGDGQGTEFIRFMDATRAEIAKWQGFERDFKAYRAAMDEFFKLDGVKKLEDGRFSYPSTLVPPKPPTPPDGKDRDDRTPLKHLNILARDRSDEDLQRDITERFAKIGIKLGR